MRPSNRLMSAPRGDADTAIAFAEQHGAKRLGDVVQYIAAVFRYAPELGLDPAIVVSQSALETANWTSSWWRLRLNPSGLGITGDSQQNERSGYWANGEAAALAHLHHLGIYVGVDMLPWKPHNPRWQAAVDAGYFGIAATIDDLTGRWAVDPNYAEQIAAKGNILFPGIQDQEVHMTIPTTFSVPRPAIYDLATDYARFGITKAQADAVLRQRFANRNGGQPRAIAFHVQDGNTPGSLGWWARPEIDASSTVMVQKDGSILRVIPEHHGPWTNGDVNRPTWQANQLLALGRNPNNWTLTMEREGTPWDAVPRAQFDAILWQAEDWIMRYPDILSMEWCLIRHGWLNSVSRPNCPDAGEGTAGAYFDAMVRAINEWLDGAVVMPEPPPVIEAPPLYPQRMTFELARELYEAGGKFTAPWTSKAIGFDPDRSECRIWLARGKLSMTDPADYQSGQWPHLVDVARRGRTKNVHAYIWSDGSVYEKVVRKEQ